MAAAPNNSNNRRDDLRNIAIIAHVDHGKTTLVDAMLRQTGSISAKDDAGRECIMDSIDLERERGITILSKNTSVKYGGTVIHIVDTPGHADFGSEVERVLRMVDGVLLLVDAMDGPMPQTRFVLKKSLALGLKPIVVINKIDRRNCDPHAALDKVFHLCMELGADDKQLDFPVIYACGREGWATTDTAKKGTDLKPLFDAIIKHVPGPFEKDAEPLRMLITMLDYSSYTGRIGIGRIFQGKIVPGQMVAMGSRNSRTAAEQRASGSSSVGRYATRPTGVGGYADDRERAPVTRKVMQVMGFKGLERVQLEKARSGDIVAVSGLEGVEAGDTLSPSEEPAFLDTLEIEKPTVSMEFYASDSPFAGRDGKFVTAAQLRDRLLLEAESNVGLKVEEIAGKGGFKVSGRGELHLAILIEIMRREGFELCVSKMTVITRAENGIIMEPVEHLVLDAPAEYQGAVMEVLGRRGAQMRDMRLSEDKRVRFEYVISARALIGFKSEFMAFTKGNGLMNYSFGGYLPEGKFTPPKRNGAFIAKEPGQSAAYALNSLQEHGTMFVGPGEKVYAGQIVGENCRGNDLVVNPCKEKKQTNMRSSACDESIILTPPRRFSLEQAIEYVEEDEFVEATPKSLRLRKKVLDHSLRKRSGK
ncbi:MAG: GTP-binding protein [Elusimicrobia bacterium]|nr:GTP-binding protein [Elusimicrobiota bacterium]